MEIENLRKKIHVDSIPKHIGIIMDGNGRWAKSRFLPRVAGHKEGMERVIDVVRYSLDLGVKHLTLFAFSTENWNRPKNEVDRLMDLLITFVNRELNTLKKAGVKLITLGDINEIPKKSLDAVNKAVEATKNNNKLLLNIALNYGGQDEIVRASKLIAKDVLDGALNLDSIDKNIFEDYLYTSGQPCVDLLIRPSGELRVSNFLLYQIAYAEFYFSNTYWPDFKEKEYLEAILSYQKRDRRFGGIK